MKNNVGHTIIAAAKTCKQNFMVPDSLIKLLEDAKNESFASVPIDQGATLKSGKGSTLLLTYQNSLNVYDVSTDEKTFCSESYCSGDD